MFYLIGKEERIRDLFKLNMLTHLSYLGGG